jgi:predicted metal-dependent hydrolase
VTSYIRKVHPRARSIKIRVKPDGQVVVTTPRWTPKFLVDRFVKSQQAWIDGSRSKIQDSPPFGRGLAPLREGGKNQELKGKVAIFGKKYHQKLISSHDLPYGVSIDGQNLVINNFAAKKLNHQMLLDRFLKNTAQKYIIPRTHALATKMKVDFKKITLRQQSTRWGSCSSRGNLNFNWRLIHYLPKIIDYVIIHELSHRVHMNHSREFWGLVGRFDPEYPKHKGFLKRCGMNLG